MKNIKGNKREYIAGRPSIAVDQYSLTGEFIASFSSMREAERKTGAYYNHITICIKKRRHYKTAGGYIWMLKGIKPSDEQLSAANTYQVPHVFQYTMDGILVAEYSSQIEASKQTGIHINNIHTCVAEKIKSTKGYIFKR